ncbi:hypothetical protein PAXRUDRAFT_23588 [Paxillus rubicundulus Ve08.2h10]|uniref:Transmembrane protein n=1 Tax=Paxillus rubicundulus Ve08.2h10 TaxID=930991 RepID=A0A0D0DWH4_9AGAM|nr:hypothetical protein PAXRUDRAFT_23588 [Paxillus rubicundulus Ve08.2h10]
MWFCLARAITICGLLLGWAGLAAAEYRIDNANTSVRYTSSSKASWKTFSFGTSNLTLMVDTGKILVDSSKCYNGNYIRMSPGELTAVQLQLARLAMAVKLPFHLQPLLSLPRGSGIIVYILNAGFQGVGASLSVDGGQAVTKTIAAPSAPSYQTPRVPLFSMQKMPYADHNATLNVLDWNDEATSFYFDYALINESNLEILPNQTSSIPPPSAFPVSTPSISISSSPTVSSSSNFVSVSTVLLSTALPSTALISASVRITYTSAPSPAPTSVSYIGTSINLGVIIGSACGGLVVIAALVSTLIFLKKRKSKFAKIEDVHPYPSAYNPTPSSPPPPPPPSPPQTDEKMRLRLTYYNASPSGGHPPDDDGDDDDDAESSDFQFLPSAASVRRVSTIRSSLNTLAPGIEPPLPDDLIFDLRRASSPHVAFEATTTGSPPSYQTVGDVTLDR